MQANVNAAEEDPAAFKPGKSSLLVQNAINVLEYQIGRDHEDPQLVAALFASQPDLPNLKTALKVYRGSHHDYRRVRGWIRNCYNSVGAALYELDNGEPPPELDEDA